MFQVIPRNIVVHPSPIQKNAISKILFAGWIAISFPLAAATPKTEDPFALARTKFAPLPENFATPETPLSPERVALGRRIFFDKALSTDGTVSCETCHLPGLHATDGQPKAVGVEKKLNARNAPTLLNTALQFRQHWDGLRASVEEQATKSLTGPLTFGNPNTDAVIAKFKNLGYEPDFRKAFKDQAEPISPENWGQALGSYERTLVSPSPLDAYLRGNLSALDAKAIRGLASFINMGCSQCHEGTLLGGTQYQKFGLYGEYQTLTGSAAIDEGRFKITQDPKDRFVFKVPPLRNVAMTPPYFHDGSVEDLPSAIRIMGKLQLNRSLSDGEVSDIEAFLQSLTGTIPENLKAPTATP